MKWMKAAGAGLLGSAVMQFFLVLCVRSGMATIRMTPASAFLEATALAPPELGAAVHFIYGSFWSLVLVYLFRESTDMKNGMILSVFLWILMMTVHSSIIGWGLFGLGSAGSELSETHPLYLGSGLRYSTTMLIAHLVYGGLTGLLARRWIGYGHIRMLDTGRYPRRAA